GQLIHLGQVDVERGEVIAGHLAGERLERGVGRQALVVLELVYDRAHGLDLAADYGGGGAVEEGEVERGGAGNVLTDVDVAILLDQLGVARLVDPLLEVEYGAFLG